MTLEEVYAKIDAELETLIEKEGQDYEGISKHKANKLNEKKGYAFMLWFMRFYGRGIVNGFHTRYITDGHDDHSCDIMFPLKDGKGVERFYVVQSKWVSKPGKSIDKKEFGTTLSEFSALLNGTFSPSEKNEAFNEQYQDLQKHLKGNGKVRFVYFTLAQPNTETALKSLEEDFNEKHSPNASLMVIDLQRLMRNYIEFRYKGYHSSNPLEYDYTPQNDRIELNIVRGEGKRNVMDFRGRTQAQLLLLKPSTIHRLFSTYKFSLFVQNVRNPLPESNYNEQMANTLRTQPDSFWYYNNGITAITRILDDIGDQAERIQITGLQVINGAQTVYSVYKAYEEADPIQREIIDKKVRISLRLIESNDEQFNLAITRYTNSQNPMVAEDFYANDPIQVRLQEESFAYPVWYARRRGEFRNVEGTGIEVVNKEEFVLPYVAFHLQRPSLYAPRDRFFISEKEDPEGLYETIFVRSSPTFEQLYISYRLYGFLFHALNEFSNGDGNMLGLDKNKYSENEWNRRLEQVIISSLSLLKTSLLTYYELTEDSLGELYSRLSKTLHEDGTNTGKVIFACFLEASKALGDAPENLVEAFITKDLTEKEFTDLHKVLKQKIDPAAIAKTVKVLDGNS